MIGAQSGHARVAGYEAVSTGTRAFDIGRTAVEVLVEEANLGGLEVEIVEMTFPPGGARTGGEHRNGRVEIFYVLRGVLEHEVNGVAHRLDPGMVGIVRPEDAVAHREIPGHAEGSRGQYGTRGRETNGEDPS